MKEKRTYVPELDPEITLGLSTEQARQRMEAGWSNRVSGSALPSEGQIILANCFTYFNLVFAVLALVLVLVRSSVVNFGFLGVVVFNLAIGTLQQIRAKRAVEKLTLVAARARKVIRDGKHVQLRDEELVRDDLVIFRAGEQLCADAILRDGSLQVNEALVTGEADPVEKQPGDELMSGSFVVAGSGTVQLVRVGDDSYAARLAAEARKDPRAAKSEMMADLDKLIRFLSVILVPLGVLYFLGAVAVPHPDTKEAAQQTVAALVSMIPQGLYLLTSVAMAASAIRLSRRKVLAQDMSCIETLARVDVLCVDKTGTITEPGMQVEELLPLGGAEPAYLQQVLGSLYAGEPENDTARAIAEMYTAEKPWEPVRRIPFAAHRRWSGGVFREGSFLVGAPQTLLGQRFGEMEETVNAWAKQGFRVLLLSAYEGIPEPCHPDSDRITPLALVLLKSRIRETAWETFRFFREQGVTVKVISGDDPATAADAAKRAGIPGSENYVNCEGLFGEALAAAAEAYTVFGRVTPEQKKALVEALKAGGHTVAMTGDGVNDVLAMRAAHCAVAMAGGAQAASQVAQLVLLKDDFSAMPHIVAEGRRVVGNIQRAAALFLVKNIFTVLLVLTALLTPFIYPFQPVTLTVINALTVGLPSLVLALEPNRERIRGRFLQGALERALPGGLAIFLALTVAQLMDLSSRALFTAAAVILSAVGLCVLVKVSQPMTRLRKGVVLAMALLLAAALLVLGPVFEVWLLEPGALWAGLLGLLAVCLFAGLTALLALWKKET